MGLLLAIGSGWSGGGGLGNPGTVVLSISEAVAARKRYSGEWVVFFDKPLKKFHNLRDLQGDCDLTDKKQYTQNIQILNIGKFIT